MDDYLEEIDLYWALCHQLEFVESIHGMMRVTQMMHSQSAGPGAIPSCGLQQPAKARRGRLFLLDGDCALAIW